jgi:integrase
MPGGSPANVEDGGINVIQQKTGKELWVPLHAELRTSLETWEGSPYVRTPKGVAYTPGRFRSAWTRFMNDTPAGRIRQEGFTFHGLRASSCEKLYEAGCSEEEISSITGMSPAMIRRYLRFADQKRLGMAAVRRLEGRTARERRE